MTLTNEEIKALHDSLKKKTETPLVIYRAFGHDLRCCSVAGGIEGYYTAWFYPKQIHELKDYEEIEVKIELHITESFCYTEFCFIFHAEDSFSDLKRITCKKLVDGSDFSENVLERHLQNFVCAIKMLR